MWELLFQPNPGTCGLPKFHPYMYFVIDWAFSLATWLFTFLFCRTWSAAWWSWVIILGSHHILMAITDYGPGKLPGVLSLCNVKKTPVVVMFAYDWLIDANYIFGWILFEGYSEVGNLVFPTVGVAGMAMLVLLDPLPYSGAKKDGVRKQ